MTCNVNAYNLDLLCYPLWISPFGASVPTQVLICDINVSTCSTGHSRCPKITWFLKAVSQICEREEKKKKAECTEQKDYCFWLNKHMANNTAVCLHYSYIAHQTPATRDSTVLNSFLTPAGTNGTEFSATAISAGLGGTPAWQTGKCAKLHARQALLSSFRSKDHPWDTAVGKSSFCAHAAKFPPDFCPFFRMP